MLLIIFIITLCILIPIVLSKEKKKMMRDANDVFYDFAKNNNLTITKGIDIPNYNGGSKFFVDDVNKTVNFLSYLSSNPSNVTHKQFTYKDVLKCELIKDEKKVLVEDAFSITDRLKQKEYVKKFGLRITFNDLSFPFLDILFINSTSGQTLFGQSHIVNAVNEWVSIMNIVIERGKAQQTLSL